MTRAELRRQKKLEGKKDKIYHLTQAQIDKMKEEVGKLKMNCVERLKNIRLKEKYKW